VVVDGETGFQVPLEQQKESPFEPVDPQQFARDLAARVNELMGDEDLCRKMGAAGRQRVLDLFSWASIAQQTVALYEELGS
jgi:starch synthase